MKWHSRVLMSAAVLGLSQSPVAAGELNTSLKASCPATATAGSAVNLNLDLVNDEASSLNVRVVAGYAGNANGTLGGIGIYGPQVIAQTAVNGLSTSHLMVAAPPALPSALIGSVATYIAIAEWQGGPNNVVEPNVDTCLVEVRSP